MLVGISKLKLDSGDEHDEECFDSAPPLAPGLAPGLAPASLLLDMATLVGAFKAATGWTGSAVKLCGGLVPTLGPKRWELMGSWTHLNYVPELRLECREIAPIILS